jgi:integrase
MRGAGVIRYAGKRGVVWRIKYVDAEGTQVQETLGPESEGWTRKKAKAELRERMVKVEKKGWRKPSPLTFDEYADTWLEEGKRKRAWAKTTVWVYEDALTRLRESFGTRPLALIRPRHIAEYVAARSENLGAATVNRDVSILSDIFKCAKQEELVESNPAEGVERPKLPKRKWRILKPAEVPAVLKAFTNDYDRTVFLTLVLTGVRRGELQALRWRDVELIENVLRVQDSKTEEGVRSIALPPRLAEALWKHRQATAYQGEDEYVFAHPDRGSRLSADHFAESFRAALAVAGITDYIRPFHDLRHTAITNAAAAGANPTELMTMAGNTDMRTTRIYTHLAGVVFPDAAKALEDRLLGVTRPPSLNGVGGSVDEASILSGIPASTLPPRSRV